MEEALADKDYLLEKYPGKGGWTYTVIPEISPDKHSPFGWVKVKGTIDGYEFKNYHLLPTAKGGGQLFLSVKADIRKAIKKEAGDYVRIVLYLDDDPLEVPEELLLCLREKPEALKFFNALSESEKRNYVNWIYSAKRDKTKVERIACTLDRLMKKQKHYT